MTRLILSLEEQDKAWLEHRSRESGLSMAEVLRQALRRMRQDEEGSLDQALASTRGLWQKGDGLKYQRALRREWE